MATLLPNGVQQFIDGNGVPLAGGSVFFYVPNTTTPKDTWQDSGQVTLNTNPVILDASGEAIIYGSGVYRQQVFDSAGNLVWDQLTSSTDAGGTAWGGTSTGAANVQLVSSSFSEQDGQQLAFIAGFTNTSALTVNGIAVLLDGLGGPIPLTGGEVVEDNAITLIYDGPRGAFHLVQNNRYDIVPPGAVMQFAMSTVPSGWLECNGSSLLRASYPALFAAIGTTFGAADGTHFTIPDLRAEFVRGWDHGKGTDPARVFGSNQTDANKAHVHTATFTGTALPAHSHTYSIGGLDTAGGIAADGASVNASPSTSSVSAGTPAGTVTVDSSGTESRPINVALMFCIKT